MRKIVNAEMNSGYLLKIISGVPVEEPVGLPPHSQYINVPEGHGFFQEMRTAPDSRFTVVQGGTRERLFQVPLSMLITSPNRESLKRNGDSHGEEGHFAYDWGAGWGVLPVGSYPGSRDSLTETDAWTFEGTDQGVWLPIHHTEGGIRAAKVPGNPDDGSIDFDKLYQDGSTIYVKLPGSQPKGMIPQILIDVKAYLFVRANQDPCMQQIAHERASDPSLPPYPRLVSLNPDRIGLDVSSKKGRGALNESARIWLGVLNAGQYQLAREQLWPPLRDVELFTDTTRDIAFTAVWQLYTGMPGGLFYAESGVSLEKVTTKGKDGQKDSVTCGQKLVELFKKIMLGKDSSLDKELKLDKDPNTLTEDDKKELVQRIFAEIALVTPEAFIMVRELAEFINNLDSYNTANGQKDNSFFNPFLTKENLIKVFASVIPCNDQLLRGQQAGGISDMRESLSAEILGYITGHMELFSLDGIFQGTAVNITKVVPIDYIARMVKGMEYWGLDKYFLNTGIRRDVQDEVMKNFQRNLTPSLRFITQYGVVERKTYIKRLFEALEDDFLAKWSSFCSREGIVDKLGGNEAFSSELEEAQVKMELIELTRLFLTILYDLKSSIPVQDRLYLRYLKQAFQTRFSQDREYRKSIVKQYGSLDAYTKQMLGGYLLLRVVNPLLLGYFTLGATQTLLKEDEEYRKDILRKNDSLDAYIEKNFSKIDFEKEILGIDFKMQTLLNRYFNTIIQILGNRLSPSVKKPVLVPVIHILQSDYLFSKQDGGDLVPGLGDWLMGLCEPADLPAGGSGNGADVSGRRAVVLQEGASAAGGSFSERTGNGRRSSRFPFWKTIRHKEKSSASSQSRRAIQFDMPEFDENDDRVINYWDYTSEEMAQALLSTFLLDKDSASDEQEKSELIDNYLALYFKMRCMQADVLRFGRFDVRLGQLFTEFEANMKNVKTLVTKAKASQQIEAGYADFKTNYTSALVCYLKFQA
ncbi:hypothetical protein ACFL96_17995, partial [Thermoproteota archaeon]